MSIYSRSGAVMVATMTSQLAISMVGTRGCEFDLACRAAWRDDRGVEIDQLGCADDTVRIMAHGARCAQGHTTHATTTSSATTTTHHAAVTGTRNMPLMARE